jgi:hypothetical protein
MNKKLAIIMVVHNCGSKKIKDQIWYIITIIKVEKIIIGQKINNSLLVLS